MKSKLLVITPVKHIENFLPMLKKNFEFKIIENPNSKIVSKILRDYDYIFTNPNMSKIYLDEKILNGSNLKAICTASTGTNHIDLNYIKRNNIKLISLTKEFKLIRKLSSTAELAFCLTLNGLRKISQAAQSVRKGKWDYIDYVGKSLKGLKVLTLGYGRLGKIYLNYCLSFGAEVFAYDPYLKKKSNKVKFIYNLGKNLKKFDIISINIHANKKNLNFLNKRILKHLKKDIIIVNTSRGEVVNEVDLINCLNKNKKMLYLSDVVKDEQRNLKNNKLIKIFKKGSDQIFITPHVGGMTKQGQELAYKHALSLLISFDKK